jgi:hypothetical protein
MLFILKDYERAEQTLKVVLDFGRESSKPDAEVTISSQFTLAGVYCHTGRYEQGLRLLLKNLRVYDGSMDWRHSVSG